MNNPDYDTIIRAVEDVRSILGNTAGTRSERCNVCLPCSIGATLYMRLIE
jgi:hypothetical protein